MVICSEYPYLFRCTYEKDTIIELSVIFQEMNGNFPINRKHSFSFIYIFFKLKKFF